MDPTEDLYVSRDTCETPIYLDFDYNPFEDENTPLATEQETVEPQIPAQEVKCKEPRGNPSISCADVLCYHLDLCTTC